MTRRRSKRELERAVDDLAPAAPKTPHGWVNSYLENGWFEDGGGFEYTVVGADGEIIQEPDHSGKVCIWKAHSAVGTEFWAPEEDVPDWIDIDEDLPVRE